jgi:hypothetical protein
MKHAASIPERRVEDLAQDMVPVIAESIRKMAAGRADIIGKSNATHVAALIETARQLGLEKELAIAWERGN